MSYSCSVCGENHPGPPWVWGPDAPDAWNAADESQKSEGELSSDQCVLPDKERARSFVRGRLEIPALGNEESFAWLVWVEVEPNDFLDMREKWFQSGRETTPPYDGVLANLLPIYEHETLGLPVRLHTRPVGERPFVEVAGEHQLATEQSAGISESKIQEIAELLSH
jgi:hypothetical protein